MLSNQSQVSRTLKQSPKQTIPFNPQDKAFIKSQAKNRIPLTQNCFDIEILRIKTQKVSRFAQNLFNLNEEQLNHDIKSYKSLPQSPVKISQLFLKPNCRLIKSSEQKIYIGETLNKKKHGQGVAIYKDGKIYQGTFENNQRNGFGIEIYPNGNLYIGNFKHNKKHGKGNFYWFSMSQIPCIKDAEIIVEHYQGEWWGGLPDGKGQHYNKNGDIYLGEFKNGLKHGKGTQKYANGDLYEGDYINGLCQGTGTFRWRDGSVYDGDFKQGYRNGYGIWQSNQSINQTYQGHYMLDKKHGYGIYDWGNGYIYKGNYIQDQRNGYGQLYYQNQLMYKGQWMNGQKLKIFQRQQLNFKQCIEQSEHKIENQTKQNIQSLTESSSLNNRNKYELIYPQKQKKPYFNEFQYMPNEDDKIPIQKGSEFCILFKKQPEEKSGHRNCIYCRQLQKRKKKQLSKLKSNRKQTSQNKIKKSTKKKNKQRSLSKQKK